MAGSLSSKFPGIIITPQVRTLIAYLPADSAGFRTSVPGRMAFLLVSSTITLVAIKDFPLKFVPHCIGFLIYCFSLWFVGAKRVLFSRTALMLLVTSGLIAIVNFALPPPVITNVMDRMNYAATRSSAYASLAFATILVASLTRPSDVARLTTRVTAKRYPFLLAAIPFATFEALSSTYVDILHANRSRLVTLKQPRKTYQLIVDASAGLFATALNRALYLYQATQPFLGYPPEHPHENLLGKEPLFRFGDLVLLLPVLLVASLLLI